MVKVAVLDDYQNVALKMADWSVLPKDARVTVFNDHVADRAKVIERLRDFDVLCVMRERTPLPRAIIEALPKLKLIVTTGMRNFSIDMKAAQERGVAVCGTGGVGHPTAELTWALILGFMRNIHVDGQAMREGGWQTRLGRGLKGRTLGLVGLGNLGGRVARIGVAFGMNVLAWSQNLTHGRAGEVGAQFSGKEELLRQSDIVSIHLVLSDRSRGLIGRQELALMKQDAVLVNTSRGPIVDEPALIDALQNRRIGGAALDVYDVEPLPRDHPFRHMPNVLLTPHVGYVTDDNYAVLYRETVEDVKAFLEGKPVRVLQP
ncbi:MAG: D-2-hydroxyacid dehydrogenase family protein [Reyranellaceae bacterium]